jgi:hypothetical protein
MRLPLRSAVHYAALLAVLVVSACGPARRQARGPEPAQTTVRVENRNFMDMNIFVLRGNQRVRLGTVPGMSTRVLTISPTLIFGSTPLRFLADPIGSRQTPISDDIVVREGDQVTMIIPN